MTAQERIAASIAETQARLEAILADRADLHQKMTALVEDLNAQGVKVEQSILGLQGELKALQALESSLGE